MSGLEIPAARLVALKYGSVGPNQDIYAAGTLPRVNQRSEKVGCYLI